MDDPQQSRGTNLAFRKLLSRGAGITTRTEDRLLSWLQGLMLRYRYPTVLLIVLVFLLVEILEHVIERDFGSRAHQIFDLVIYALLTPALAWLVLAILRRAERARQQATIQMDLQAELSQQLSNAPTWEALVTAIAAFPQHVSPQASATLYVYNLDTRQPQAEAARTRDGKTSLRPAAAHPTWQPARELVGGPPELIPLPATGGDAPELCYELPIVRNHQQVGLLALDYPADSPPGHTELQALHSAAPVIALALEGALLQSLAAKQAADSENERQQIAQNLHDTLAQNIGYLRLKLDQLTGENTFREIGMVLQELERMRATADEAYAQVRSTLDELAPLPGEDLLTYISKPANAICERAGLRLHTSQTGAPFPLPGKTRQHIYYIAREALNNVEKHACASQVHLHVLWLENEIIVKIADDGIGFMPLAIQPDGHYGLWIMQQRAKDLGGALKIAPADDKGTEISLWLPRTRKARVLAPGA